MIIFSYNNRDFSALFHVKIFATEEEALHYMAEKDAELQIRHPAPFWIGWDHYVVKEGISEEEMAQPIFPSQEHQRLTHHYADEMRLESRRRREEMEQNNKKENE